MNLSATFRSRHEKRRPLGQLLLVGSWCTVGTVLFTGCADVEAVSEHVERSFNADSSLLSPATSTTYSVSGEIRESEQVEAEAAAPNEAETEIVSEASGTLVTSDGVITSIELVASLEAPDDIRFVLTEPALYERRGEPLDTCVTIGTLMTSSATYPDTKVVLTPKFTEDGTFAEATFQLPESFASERQFASRTVRLSLVLEPLATFDPPTSAKEGLHEDEPRSPGEQPSTGEDDSK